MIMESGQVSLMMIVLFTVRCNFNSSHCLFCHLTSLSSPISRVECTDTVRACKYIPTDRVCPWLRGFATDYRKYREASARLGQH